MKNKKGFPDIKRRDFCQGLAMSAVGLATTMGMPTYARNNLSKNIENNFAYPPALTGMRGAHLGSFEVAHQLGQQNRKWPTPSQQTDKQYDLVVVGAGISGLSAAYFFQKKYGKEKKVLVLDNHDDFGGHAKRNEFESNGNRLLGYGGSESIDAPSGHSKVVKNLFRDLAIDTDEFYKAFDDTFYTANGLGNGLYFNKKDFGHDRLIKDDLLAMPFVENAGNKLRQQILQYPISENAQKELFHLLTSSQDYLKGKSNVEKISFLEKISYRQYLTQEVGVSEEVADLFQRTMADLTGVEADSVPAIYFYNNDYPGFHGLNLRHQGEHTSEEPYIFHFPDGNASIARLLVRELIPEVAAGDSMQDVVTTKFDYAQLDKIQHAARIRLNSTVVDTQNNGDNGTVDITYVRGDSVERVNASKVVLACYNQVIPYLCPSIPEKQKRALDFQEKVPLLYTNVVIKNWRAFKRAGVSEFYCPGPDVFYQNVFLDFPVSLGDYQFSKNPDKPIVVVMWRTPTGLGRGRNAREQYRQNRYEMLGLSFADIETKVREQLQSMLGAYGFDHFKDIDAITVNRWPHGYAYEYNSLFDPDWPEGEAPHFAARQPLGNIHIANSDSEALAYVNGAIDAAYRAVNEM